LVLERGVPVQEERVKPSSEVDLGEALRCVRYELRKLKETVEPLRELNVALKSSVSCMKYELRKLMWGVRGQDRRGRVAGCDVWVPSKELIEGQAGLDPKRVRLELDCLLHEVCGLKRGCLRLVLGHFGPELAGLREGQACLKYEISRLKEEIGMEASAQGEQKVEKVEVDGESRRPSRLGELLRRVAALEGEVPLVRGVLESISCVKYELRKMLENDEVAARDDKVQLDVASAGSFAPKAMGTPRRHGSRRELEKEVRQLRDRIDRLGPQIADNSKVIPCLKHEIRKLRDEVEPIGLQAGDALERGVSREGPSDLTCLKYEVRRRQAEEEMSAHLNGALPESIEQRGWARVIEEARSDIACLRYEVRRLKGARVPRVVLSVRGNGAPGDLGVQVVVRNDTTTGGA
jgi:hypothetical protein